MTNYRTFLEIVDSRHTWLEDGYLVSEDVLPDVTAGYAAFEAAVATAGANDTITLYGPVSMTFNGSGSNVLAVRVGNAGIERRRQQRGQKHRKPVIQ